MSSCSCKSKLWRCLILGFLRSAAHSGLHSRTLAAGSRALGKLWAPLLYARFKGGHWRPSQSRWHGTRTTNPGFGNEKEKGCLQSVSLLNKSEMKPWVFLRHFGISRLLVLFPSPFYIVGRSVFKAEAALYKWLFPHFPKKQQECSFPLLFFLFFFSSKRLLSGATCDWWRQLALCFDALGWTLLGFLFFYLLHLFQSIIVMATEDTGRI